MSLSLECLSAGYGRIPVVQEVSLAVAPGEIVGMVGRNGVGKTTLVKAVAGLLPQVRGRVCLAGEDVTARAAHERALRGMGYVPQGRGIFPKLTVLENLRMGEAVGGGHDQRHYDQVLDWFPRLRERLRQIAGTLSGGEQQMLSIGRVLIGKPSLLVLDEPSEGVQPNIVERIAEVVLELNQVRGTAVLLVEQNLDLVFMIADRCLVMEKGALVAKLSPEALAEPETAKRYLAI